MASRSLKVVAAVLPLVSEALAQSVNETVWSSFAYILYGERTPLQGETAATLTPLGAQQLYSQGSLFRARYLSNSSLSDEDNTLTTNSPIVGIERQALDNSQLSISSTTKDYVVGGALAFMQGLYPPVTQTFAYNNDGANASTLANGSSVDFPLDGYQYPNVKTVPITDSSSVWLEGHTLCTQYWSSGNEFRTSATNEQMYNSTLDFYETTFAEVFPNTLPRPMLSFDYAYDSYDYAAYAYNHDESVRNALGVDRLAILRNLANVQQLDLNANLSASGSQEGDMIRAISGRTLAAKAVAQLSAHIASGGSSSKLTLMFGSFEPMLAFFALSDLTNLATSGLFRQIPLPGSAMVFELFSTSNDSSYPEEDDLWVRFLFRNGTGSGSPITEYPLFGRGNSETRMRWDDFATEINKFSIRSVSSWCNICEAFTLFCSSLSHSHPGSSSLGNADNNSNTSLSPAVAGVIGAVAAIAVLSFAGTTAFVFGGMRIRRKDESNKRRSSLGGFKGAEKMASDHDVTFAGSGVRHERVGSWELGGPGRPAAGTTIPVPAPTAESVPSNIFGASIKRSGKDNDDDDVDSIAGRAPVKPLEGV
ncbi:hypothetical protein AAE478_005236 [Parahypoxylon ruwenzoriense]